MLDVGWEKTANRSMQFSNIQHPTSPIRFSVIPPLQPPSSSIAVQKEVPCEFIALTSPVFARVRILPPIPREPLRPQRARDHHAPSAPPEDTRRAARRIDVHLFGCVEQA